LPGNYAERFGTNTAKMLLERPLTSSQSFLHAMAAYLIPPMPVVGGFERFD
jgi:hypothetical protein